MVSLKLMCDEKQNAQQGTTFSYFCLHGFFRTGDSFFKSPYRPRRKGKDLASPHELIELRRIGRSASGSIISIFVYSGGLDGIIYSLFGTAFGSNDLCLKHPQSLVSGK